MQKNSLICLFLALAFTLSLQAQVHKDFGIKAGINLANLKAETTSSFDNKLGIHLGAFAHLHFSTNWAVQPELVYSAQGAKQTIGGDDYKYKLNYINIPVMFQYMTGTGFRLQTGPQLGFLLSAKAKNDAGTTDVKDVFKALDFAWALGAGYVSDGGLGFDARYNLGLMDINEQSGGTVKNRVWQLGLFYQFNVTKNGVKHIQ